VSRRLPGLLSCGLIFALACSQEASPPQTGSGASWFEGARLIVGDGSGPVEDAAFLVEGDTIAWVGRKGERQPPEGAARVDLSGKTVMPALIDGHNHNGLTNIRDGSNSKANYTRENLVDQLERCAYYGVGATLSMGLEADPEVAYRLRDEASRMRRVFTGKGM
jgi:imidazolonepropionase-like amidohydrolase